MTEGGGRGGRGLESMSHRHTLHIGENIELPDRGDYNDSDWILTMMVDNDGGH